MRTALFIALTATLATGCVTKKKYNALSEQLQSTQAELAESQEEAAGYVLQIDDLKDQVAALENENEQLAAYYEDLIEEFGTAMQDGELELVMYPDRSVLGLSENIVFATGSASLRSDGDEAVAQLANLLKNHPDRHFQIQGHTDSRPIATSRYPSNWSLGAARAVTVVEALIDAGVSEEQVSAATYGATSPVASNGSDDGMRQNRRIAVTLDPTIDEVPGHLALLKVARESGIVRSAHGQGDPIARR